MGGIVLLRWRGSGGNVRLSELMSIVTAVHT